MKRWHKLVLVAAIVVVLSAVLLALVVRLSMSGPVGTVAVDGLAQDVEIRFDQRLRPFVDARAFDDALFAEGWLHARYRLWQMELLRRAGRGRLAEAFGETMLESDIGLWKAGVPQLAAMLEEEANASTLAHVDAYVAGVNAGLRTYRILPPELLLTGIEPVPWARRDVFATGAIIAFQSANNMSQELLRLALAGALDKERFAAFLPDETSEPGFPYVLRERELIVRDPVAALDAFDKVLLPNASLGSSGWAVSPQRSATGNALFAFDSHDALNLPSLFYEVHLFYGAGKSVRGWSLPGLPGVINGFNERVAWGMTNIGDTQDLYVEKRSADDPFKFELDGAWYTARTETVDIPVKGRDNAESLTVVYTTNGPLISDEPPVSLRWIGHDIAGRGLDALLEMNTAENWEQFEAAIDRHGAPSANITYADRDGQIAFRTIGLIPVRATGNGLVPLSGNDSANRWTARVADGELPELVNPENGYVAAANARVHAGSPLVSADNAAGYRMRRLHDVLSAGGEFTMRDMGELQLDTYNTQAARLLPHMLPERQRLLGELDDRAMEIVRSWSDHPLNDAASVGALIWEHWYPELARTVFGAALDEDLLSRLLKQSYVLNHALDRLVVSDHDSPWWQGRRERLLEESFSNAVDAIASAQGDDPDRWRWDTAHAVSFRHELHGVSRLLDRWLSRGPFPWGGGHPVLARARYGYDAPFEGRAGATVRVVIEMSEPLAAFAIMPGGQHGHPLSPHYDDQLPVWLDGKLSPIAGSLDDIAGPVTRLSPTR